MGVLILLKKLPISNLNQNYDIVHNNAGSHCSDYQQSFFLPTLFVKIAHFFAEVLLLTNVW